MTARFAARRSGLAFGLALAVRPAGLAEAPALKGGSWRSFLRSGWKRSPGALDAGGADPDSARRSGLILVTFRLAIGHLARGRAVRPVPAVAAIGRVAAGTGCRRCGPADLVAAPRPEGRSYRNLPRASEGAPTCGCDHHCHGPVAGSSPGGSPWTMTLGSSDGRMQNSFSQGSRMTQKSTRVPAGDPTVWPRALPGA